MNLYVYVDGNPVTRAAPLGLDKVFQGTFQGGGVRTSSLWALWQAEAE